MKLDVVHILKKHGIRPTVQRVAVAEYVLYTKEHPSADKVWAGVQQNFPTISRATVYNALNLYVKKGLLRVLDLAPTRCSSIRTRVATTTSTTKTLAGSTTSPGINSK